MTLHRRPKDLGTVVLSVNEYGGAICVDFFERPDGTFGFEEYRRDAETGEGWFPIGFHSSIVCKTLDEAKQRAAANIGWLDAEL